MIDGSVVIRILIRAYPRAFREQFGRDMLAAHLDQRDALRARRQSTWRATLTTAISLIRALPAVYADERTRTRTTAAHLSPRSNALMTLGYDLKHAVRSLRKQPAFTAIAIITLALGIGANTAVFSVLNNVILAPLPYNEPDRIVRLYSQVGWSTERRGYHAQPDILDVRNEVRSFSDVGIMYVYREVGTDLMVDGVPQRIRVLPISADYFSALGATPAMGRAFTRDEERGDARYVILSHELWSTVTNRDPNVIGRRVVLSGEGYEVVGVMRSGFRDVAGNDVMAWIPQNLQPARSNSRSNFFLSAIARLAPGVSLAQARQELDALMARLRAQLPDSNDGHRMTATLLHEDVVGESRTPVYVLMGAASLVLLIACLNVASLFLARAVAQGRETAIRTALGARRSRLVRHRLTESLLVASMGGVVGTAVAYTGVKLLLMVSPASLPRAEDVGFDTRLFGFALVTTLVTGLLFGTAPAVRASQVDPMDALHDSSRGNTEGRGGRRWRNVLVAAQVACAVVLLTGAGTLIRSFVALQRVDLGFSPDSVATFDISLPPSRYADPAQRVQLHHRLHDAIAAAPGVSAVGATSWLPANGAYHIWGVNYTNAAGEQKTLPAQVRVVTGDFFSALKGQLIAGTGFPPGTLSDSLGAVIVNARLAREAFGNAPPIGKQINTSGRNWIVVGVVNDMAFDATGTRSSHVYVNHDQFAGNRNWSLSYVVRSSNVSQTIAAARRVLVEIDPQLVLYQPRSLNAVVGTHRARHQFTLLLMGTFAAVALTLAAVGVFGVLSYSVTQRTHEIGVRLALGAQVAQVLRIVVSQGALVAGIGLLIGLGAAFALGGVLQTLVFGVAPRDPLVFGVVTLLLVIVATTAGLMPARRATRVDPGIALRGE